MRIYSLQNAYQQVIEASISSLSNLFKVKQKRLCGRRRRRCLLLAQPIFHIILVDGTHHHQCKTVSTDFPPYYSPPCAHIRFCLVARVQTQLDYTCFGKMDAFEYITWTHVLSIDRTDGFHTQPPMVSTSTPVPLSRLRVCLSFSLTVYLFHRMFGLYVCNHLLCFVCACDSIRHAEHDRDRRNGERIRVNEMDRERERGRERKKGLTYVFCVCEYVCIVIIVVDGGDGGPHR